MKEMKLGVILSANRRKRGITQEELASHLGVSKASVSKWETGSTYPDIVLLPRLAAFFGISIDELMGYEPQMEVEEIRRLYQKLAEEFSKKPYEEVMGRCGEIVRKYYACPPLLLALGNLYVNHCMLAPSPEGKFAALEEAKKLFIRVREESKDVSLCDQALGMEAYCLLCLGRAEEVPGLLESSFREQLPVDVLLATAYAKLDEPKRAGQVLQGAIYMTMLKLVNLFSAYLTLCRDREHIYREACRRVFSLADSFHLETLHPGVLLSLYLAVAQGFAIQGKGEETLEILERYIKLVLSDIWPLRLQGDGFFDLLEDWLEQNSILGRGLPRDSALILQSAMEAVEDPAFAFLREDVRYRNLLRRLREREELHR